MKLVKNMFAENTIKLHTESVGCIWRDFSNDLRDSGYLKEKFQLRETSQFTLVVQL